MIKSRVAMACIASLVVAALHPASAQMFADKSVTLSSGSVTPILAPMQYPKIRSYYVVQNVGQTGVAWCSDSDPAPAPYKPDSFPLTAYGAPYGMATKREFLGPMDENLVPQNGLWCTADAGTVSLTVEVVER
jgi:hypothetical protein